MRSFLSWMAGAPLGIAVAVLASVSLLRGVVDKPVALTDLEWLAAGRAAFSVLPSPDGTPVISAWPLGDGNAALLTQGLPGGSTAHVLDAVHGTTSIQPATLPTQFWKQVPGRWFTVDSTTALSTADYHDCTLRQEPGGAAFPVIPECDVVAAATRLSTGTILVTYYNANEKRTVAVRLEPGSATWSAPEVLPAPLHTGDLQAGVDGSALYSSAGRYALYEHGTFRVLSATNVDRLGARAVLLHGGAVLVFGGFARESNAISTAFAVMPWLGLAAAVLLILLARKRLNASGWAMGLGVVCGVMLVVAGYLAILLMGGWH